MVFYTPSRYLKGGESSEKNSDYENGYLLKVADKHRIQFKFQEKVPKKNLLVNTTKKKQYDQLLPCYDFYFSSN